MAGRGGLSDPRPERMEQVGPDKKKGAGDGTREGTKEAPIHQLSLHGDHAYQLLVSERGRVLAEARARARAVAQGRSI